MSPARTKVLVALTIILIVSVASITIYFQSSLEHIPNLSRVALVGDSITQITSYPHILQSILGSNSTVGNFGESGSTVTLSSIKPYLFENASLLAQEFQPTTVIVMLGTNDARSDVYSGIDRFVDDYKLLISRFQALESKPDIFLVIPPPIFNNNIGIGSENFTAGVIPRIEQVAHEMGLPLIDCYTPLKGHSEYFVDGVHLNVEGSQAIANIIYRSITGKDT